MKFVSDIRNYQDVWLPHRMMNAFAETISMFSNPNWKWDEGDINGWILNQVLAPNPFVRNLASLMYLSDAAALLVEGTVCRWLALQNRKPPGPCGLGGHRIERRERLAASG